MISKTNLPPSREAVTDAYVFVMLLAFPLFTGPRGYAAITVSKYLFFTVATALWLLALAVLTLKTRPPRRRPTAAQLCALVFMALCCLSAALSPYGPECLLGAGRYDGLVTLLLCALIFLGTSAFGRLRPCHTLAFAASCTLCCLVAALQLLGLDPLWLYPGELSYYDSHILFSGEFLGTVGNVNMLSALFTLSVPLFFSLTVLGLDKYSPLYNIPLFLSTLILIASRVSGGILAVCLCALCAPPLLVRDLPTLRRALRSAALCFLAAALALGFTASPGAEGLRFSLSFGPAPLLCLSLGAACLLASTLTRLTRRAPDTRTLRLACICLSVCVLAAALLAVWLWPGTSGTVYELSQAMRGRLEDGFGSSRILIWRAVLALVPERPILGGGPGTLALRLNLTFSRYVPETGRTLSSYVDNAHNEYLRLLADTGVPGLLSYLALLLSSLAPCLRRAEAQSRLAAILLSLVCYCIQDFFGLGLCLVSPLFWIMLGLSHSAPAGQGRSPCGSTGEKNEN